MQIVHWNFKEVAYVHLISLVLPVATLLSLSLSLSLVQKHV